MRYTLDKGINARQEKIESFMLKALPILVASSIAIFGAFYQQNNRQNESNNQKPLAIYTAPATDLGNPTDPQSDGNQNSNSSADANSAPASGANQSNFDKIAPESSNTTSPTTSGLPVGGRGGGDTSGGSECLCQQLQEAVNSEVAPVQEIVDSAPVPAPTAPATTLP